MKVVLSDLLTWAVDGWPVVLEEVLNWTSPPSSTLSKSIFGFVNQNHMMGPSQRFHGNWMFGECCCDVGKVKVHW